MHDGNLPRKLWVVFAKKICALNSESPVSRHDCKGLNKVIKYQGITMLSAQGTSAIVILICLRHLLQLTAVAK